MSEHTRPVTTYRVATIHGAYQTTDADSAARASRQGARVTAVTSEGSQ